MPEYAREYLLKHGTNYTFDDLLTIAKGQLLLEEKYIKNALKQWELKHHLNYPLIFVDTDMHVMKVWCEFVFNKVHPFIEDKLSDNNADLYLLCNVDLPWVKDELREYPDYKSRKKLYDIYKNILINQQVPWVNISGNYEERLQTAINATDALIQG